MEIEVGEWVRTPEEGFIGKLVEINEDVINYYKIDVGREIKHRDDFIDNYIYSRDGFGLLHSKNIIDLIQRRRLCEWILCRKSMGTSEL